MSATKPATQLLDEQKKRLEALTRRRTRAQVETETAQKQLAEAQAESQTEFGTADIPQLRALYKNRETENGTKLAAFTAGLDKLEGQLKDIERQVA